MSTIDTIVVLVYLLGIAALGLYQHAKIKSSADYFTGGRKFSKWLMLMHALGSGTHADDPVGVVGSCYERGIAGVWYTYVYLFATPFYWVMAPFFRRSRYVTTADFFKERFGSKMSVLYTVMGMIIFAIVTGTILKGTGLIVRAVTGRPELEALAIVLMTLVFVAYGWAGGLIATVATESVQGVLIVVMSLLLVPFGLSRIGGFAALHQILDSGMFSLTAAAEVTPLWAIGCSIGMLISIVGHPHIMEVCSTGRTEFEGRVGFTYGNFVKRFCAMGWALTGVIVAALVATGAIGAPAEREDSFGIAIRELLPVGATGLMFAAVLAAQMSSLSAFMVAGSALYTRNIYKQYIQPDADDSQVLRVGRFAGFIIVGLGIIFAFIIPSVADALTVFWSLAGFMGLLIWSGVLWRRANRQGAWASFIVMALIWLYLGKMGGVLAAKGVDLPQLGVFAARGAAHLLFASFLIPGAIVMVVTSLMTRPEDPERTGKFFKLIATPVGREHELEEAGIDVVYAGETKGHPWEMNHGRKVGVIGFAAAAVFAFIILWILIALTKVGATPM